MDDTASGLASIEALLDAAAARMPLALGRAFWGFGGVHGGLALALLARAMRAHAPGQPLRQVSARFLRPLRGAFELDAQVDHAGRSVTWLSSRAIESGVTVVAATAVHARGAEDSVRSLGLDMPDVPPPAACQPYSVPSALFPLATHIEIRPVGATRPYAGGRRAELMAWLRIRGEDASPDPERLIFLMDALAPSYAAILKAPAVLPSATFNVMFGQAREAHTSPWLLLRATTPLAGRDGWLHERLDAWAEDGGHWACGEQLRVLRGSAAG
ncbi:thioesterase family protein [Fontimonas sp. SYSU GA230001]|uniref:thioesterase family protein n=1 Tax=Fontimonas sp. SYSU GA230001 TaxID=3142450 RepID=UPI0032B441F4